MSDANRNIARNAYAGKYSPAQVRRFKEAEERVSRNYKPSLELIARMMPSEGQVTAMWRDFESAPTFDFDELVGQGKTMIEDQYNTFAPIMIFSNHHGENNNALVMHLNRVVEGFIASAYGAAKFAEKNVIAAQNAADPFYNQYRDEDRRGVDGGPNRRENLRRIAAETSVRAFALYQQAIGVCAAYKELVGSDWTPWVAPSRRSVAERAEELSVSDCGF